MKSKSLQMTAAEMAVKMVTRLDTKLKTNESSTGNTIQDAYQSLPQIAFTLKAIEIVFDALDRKYSEEIKDLRDEMKKRHVNDT